jgi:hypothetical protein
LAPKSQPTVSGRASGHVGAVDEVDRRRIEEVEAMMALPRQERWALLVDREPRLLASRTRFEAARLDDCVASTNREASRRVSRGSVPTVERCMPGDQLMARITQAEIHAVNVAANSRTMLHKRIAVLLGPDSGQRDLLLGSTRAQQAAESYLLHTPE